MRMLRRVSSSKCGCSSISGIIRSLISRWHTILFVVLVVVVVGLQQQSVRSQCIWARQHAEQQQQQQQELDDFWATLDIPEAVAAFHQEQGLFDVVPTLPKEEKDPLTDNDNSPLHKIHPINNDNQDVPDDDPLLLLETDDQELLRSIYESLRFVANAETQRQALVSDPPVLSTFDVQEEPFYWIPIEFEFDMKRNTTRMIPWVARHTGQLTCPYGRIVALPESLSLRLAQETRADWFQQWIQEPAQPTTTTTTTSLQEDSSSVMECQNNDVDKDHLKQQHQQHKPRHQVTERWLLRDDSIHVTNEATHENMLQVLSEAGLDHILQNVGHEFELTTLTVTGFRWRLVGYTMPKPRQPLASSQEFAWELLVPVVLPPNRPTTISVGRWDEATQQFIMGPMTLRINRGILLSGDSWYELPSQTNNSELGLLASISLADLSYEDISQLVAQNDNCQTFYSGHSHSLAWVQAQVGRHWNLSDPTMSLQNDLGRGPFSVQDELDNCTTQEKHVCHWEMQSFCAQTCGVFVDDETYYHKWFPESNQAPEHHQSTTAE